MLKKCFSEYDQIFHFPEHVVYYKACLEPGTGCCIDDSTMHQYCECQFPLPHKLGRTYCTEQCNQDGECKGYMQLLDPQTQDDTCGIVTEGTCDQFGNATLDIHCYPEKVGSIGDLVPIPECEATGWAGCYKKFSK